MAESGQAFGFGLKSGKELGSNNVIDIKHSNLVYHIIYLLSVHLSAWKLTGSSGVSFELFPQPSG